MRNGKRCGKICITWSVSSPPSPLGIARGAAALGSTRRRGFLATNGNDVQLGGALDLVRSGGNRARLLVDVALALVVAEDYFVVVHRLQVFREERHLAAATRGVDHELRHCETRRPPAQRLDDLETLLHRSTEVLSARHLIRHI